jgi:hypothetical protein
MLTCEIIQFFVLFVRISQNSVRKVSLGVDLPFGSIELQIV